MDGRIHCTNLLEMLTQERLKSAFYVLTAAEHIRTAKFKRAEVERLKLELRAAKETIADQKDRARSLVARLRILGMPTIRRSGPYRVTEEGLHAASSLLVATAHWSLAEIYMAARYQLQLVLSQNISRSASDQTKL